MPDPKRFRFSIDRGGTFTDVYAEVPGETGYRVVKLLSENPAHYPDAPLEGIRRVLEDVNGRALAPNEIDSRQIEWIRMGTTVATNALLERKGARVALLITKGFGDLLEIGKQNRPRIFDLIIEKPALLYEAVVEVDERVRVVKTGESIEDHKIVTGKTGEPIEILSPLDTAKIRENLRALREQGIESLAVALLNSYLFPDHEKAIGELAEALGFKQVSLSCEVMPRIKIVDRGQTGCVDAYLTPHIKNYLNQFRSGFQGEEPDLFFMQSDGGLVRADSFTGSRAILSGPAGGVVGYSLTTFNRETGQPVIGFDMGGTSTDVSRFDGEYEWTHETEITGVHLLAPQLHIQTVAAGGGSRLFYRSGKFEVGPDSSGAFPGPVCYRNDGFLSLTDANLVLGRLIPEFFPKIFGPGENEPLGVEETLKAFDAFVREINEDLNSRGSPPMTREAAALGFVEVADENMVRPIRELSVARGYDVKEHVLACFGGAGAQHACSIAKALGITRIFVHRLAGILSAYGMGLADVVVEKQEPASEELGKNSLKRLLAQLDQLANGALDDLKRQGDFPTEIRRYLNLRYQGTDTNLMILEPPESDFAQAFRKVHQREFGFELSGRAIIVDDLRVRATGKSEGFKKSPIPKKLGPTPAESRTSCCFQGGWRETPVYFLEKLGPEEKIEGPAIIIHDTSTILVEPFCRALITEFGDVEIEVDHPPKTKQSAEVDPVQLSIFGNRFMSIAEQMGQTLQRTAISTNIKERCDFSCAIFGPGGDLVANAPHQPVHLGAMGEAVRKQLEFYADDIQPEDVWVTNHPITGGSHLPDITVITPVIEDGEPIFFVASRGHHADIGGTTPGSMPPFSKTLEEEGACIKTFKLVEKGMFQEEGITEFLQRPAGIERKPGEPPISGTRALADNLSDLKAQIAANRKGIELLKDLIQHYGLRVVQAYMGYLQDNAEESVRAALREMSESKGLREVDRIHAVDYMDDGSPLRLIMTIDREKGSAVFDFSGTGKEVAGNWNTPRAVTHSAILYCLRCLVQSEIPLNQGCLNPVEIVIEEGSLLSPSEFAAVAGGNVLTSQRVTDVVFRAFETCAASQGCMNNLTFGNETFGYYETIGGGAGAGSGWHGQSGVHTHMTNTRITDPEILEKRYPVLLREFSIRKGSGGSGRFNGGDGLIREIEFLQPLEVAILSERRVYAPYGMEGGNPGGKGRNMWIKNDGTRIELGGKNEFQARPGDRIRILTPGGGGYGAP